MALNVVWCTLKGTFLNDTGYYVSIPCLVCERRSIAYFNNEYLCDVHIAPLASIPQWWSEAKELGGFLI